MEYNTNIYADEVKKRLVTATPKELLKGNTHICKELEYNFIDGKLPFDVDKFDYHRNADSLNSSQVMCMNFFNKFLENDNYKNVLIKLLKSCGLDFIGTSISSAEFEHRPDKYERTSFDFYLTTSENQRISFEIKFTEPEFGGISSVEKGGNINRYADSWNKNYSRLIKNCPYFPSDLSCDKNCECTKGGVLNNSCPKSDTCGIYNFYNQFQINRNILYAKSCNDIVVFLTPRENFMLNSGRIYIEEFATQHNTKNIVNLYWEDVVEKASVLSSDYPELNSYMTKFKDKYFSEPINIPADIMTESGFVRYVEQQAKQNISVFYKNPVVNFRGRTEDANVLFTELISKWLIENIDVLNDIQQITRENSYKTTSHHGEIKNENSNRGEEILAKQMFNQSRELGPFDVVGSIIDYQTPLKNKQSDEAGKIDLLAYDGLNVRVLELKRPDSTETMLRCVLEGYTYLKTVDTAKLLADFELPPHTVIKACPLVALGGAQYDDMQEDRLYLKQLMKLLDVKVVYYTETDNRYIVENNG